MGIGGAEPGDDMITHVLGKMRKADRTVFEEAVKNAAAACSIIIGQNADTAMNRFNSKKQ